MKDKLQEIRDALNASTPGPWKWGGDKWGDPIVYSPSLRGFHNNGGEIAEIETCRAEDAHLIANTPEYLSYLLSELDAREKELELFDQRGERIETLLGELDTAKGFNEVYQQAHTEMKDSLKQLQQQLDIAKQENKHIQATKEAMFENREKWRKSHEDLTVEMNTTEQRLKQALETLEWYADYDNYSSNTAHNGHDVLADSGDRALNALSLIREEAGEETNDL